MRRERPVERPGEPHTPEQRVEARLIVAHLGCRCAVARERSEREKIAAPVRYRLE
jgi:hypothetical protein